MCLSLVYFLKKTVSPFYPPLIVSQLSYPTPKKLEFFLIFGFLPDNELASLRSQDEIKSLCPESAKYFPFILDVPRVCFVLSWKV
ncbi:Hypothetical protein FKW44_010036 [Caligus rogercresseyi]|uniref:Uncharacterized protein n=1 Tax=Caligus rogercresseyi TaxID=217165 RepID=A0A7T8HG18_CALRO|nr:Hypothetical protein FKW44_010036 [Caligus rogercresseyi]